MRNQILAALTLAFILTLSTRADEVLVTLASGDTIRATLVSDVDGTLTLKHSVLGDLTIAKTQVVKMEPAPTSQATPAISATSAPATTAVHPAENAAVVPAATDAAAALAATAEAAKPVEDPTAAKWSGTIEGNLTGVAAATTQWDLRMAAKILRESKDDRLNMYAEYFLNTLANNGTSSAITDSNLLSNITYDRFINPGKWLWFAKSQYEYDINQNWENRLGAWAGLGYRLLDEPKKYEWVVKSGAGATHEFGGIDQTNPQMFAETAGIWHMSERQKMTGSVMYTPAFNDFNNYQILARFEWSMKLDMQSGLSLLGGLREQYQSSTGTDGSTTNDFRVYLGFKLEI